MKYRIFIAFCFLIINNSFSQHQTIYNEINKIIKYDSDITYDNTPGFLVTIIDGDSVYTIPFGNKVKPDHGNLSADDIFELGSITKSFTAALFQLMANDGIINLNEKVNNYLPIEFQNPRLKNLTVWELLNHKTSFPKRPTMFGEKEEDPQNPYEYYSKNDLLEFYKKFVPERNSEFNYSHTNYALLEILAESASNTEYELLLKKYIFAPLGMENSFINFREKKNNVIALGYDRSLELTKPWTFNSFSASEGLKSNTSDLIQFIKAYMGESSSPLDKIFPKLTTYNYTSFNEKLYYSMGWHVIKINKKTRAVVSNGGSNGHSAFIGMVPENKTAVIVLSNSSYGTKDLGLLILRMVNYNWKRRPQ